MSTLIMEIATRLGPCIDNIVTGLLLLRKVALLANINFAWKIVSNKSLLAYLIRRYQYATTKSFNDIN